MSLAGIYRKRRENMKSRWSIWIAGFLVAFLAVIVAGPASAYAQRTSSVDPHRGGPFGRGLGLESLQIAAEALDMTTDELIEALQSGKTLQELAEEADVDLEEILEAIQAARVEQMRERIQQALDEGAITQEHANWILDGLDRGFLAGPPSGIMFRGHHGPRFGPGLQQMVPGLPTTGPGG